MKKGKLLATLLCSASMVMGSLVPTVPAMADAMKVVTLGADLSDEQKNTMLKYLRWIPARYRLSTLPIRMRGIT